MQMRPDETVEKVSRDIAPVMRVLQDFGIETAGESVDRAGGGGKRQGLIPCSGSSERI